VDINVLQGERPMAADNITLGQFRLDGIPPAPRGIPQIEVSFDIDSNGIVHVSAKDLGTGKEQKVTITSNSGLKPDQVDRMMKEAESHAEEDKKRKEQVEIRNEADSMVYTVDKTLKDIGEKADQSHVEKVKQAKDELVTALSGQDYDAIRAKKEALEKVLHDLSATIYNQAAGAQQAGPGAGTADNGPTGYGPGNDGGPTVDADYKVRDDQ
jgi:molecular chaperone DnaK